MLVIAGHHLEWHALFTAKHLGVSDKRIKMRRRVRGVKSATLVVVTRYTLRFDERANPFE